MCERDADLTAAHIAGLEGGTELLTALTNLTETSVDQDFTDLEAELATSRLKDSFIFKACMNTSYALSKASEWLMYPLIPFRSHPFGADRIAHLEANIS